MTVAYTTGVATSPTDLLTKLSTFVQLHGWAVGSASGGGSVIRNGETSGLAIAAAVFPDSDEWLTRGCEGYNGGATYELQPGHAAWTHSCNWGTGPFVAYHFWVGDEATHEYVHVTVEVSAGEFRHWALGRLVPYGTVDGGVYCDSTFLQTSDFLKNSPEYSFHRHLCDAGDSGGLAHLLLDYDGKQTGTWQQIVQAGDFNTNFHTGINRGAGLISPFMTIGYQRWNLRTPPWPMIYFANRPSSLRSPIGRMPNIRSVNMRNYFPGQVVPSSSDEWMYFPVFQKQIEAVGQGIVSSGLYGYAHLMP